MFGGLIAPDVFYEKRYKMHHDCVEALGRYQAICGEFEDRFGRPYDVVETVSCDDADVILATAGTITSVARLAVEELRSRGHKVGLMKIRMFRPVPAEVWRTVLGRAAKVIVVDRNVSMGAGGAFASEVQAALYPLDRRPVVFPAVAGLGGRDVRPEDVIGMFEYAMNHDRPQAPTLFWGLKE
jgi:pyruvate/2-oxoacid:ferredoxin oxidoreductase alpha subunit